tara:strand:- start:19007 stop:19222 length:216 start_codon:yes stop_codon:yes gene_type:complete
MTDKKKGTKKEKEQTPEAPLELTHDQQLEQAQLIINQLLGQVQNYQNLCAHYEQTVNILTGRLLEGRATTE